MNYIKLIMKNYYKNIILVTGLLILLCSSFSAHASLPLQGKVIVVDAGHGGLDPGTLYKNIYEKDITLKISQYLEKYLVSMGASVVLTRNNDHDLSNGVKNHRKKRDFDERIKIINNKLTDMYISIHLNYLPDGSYYGPQVFYNKKNKAMAESIQNYLNDNIKSNREAKKIPASTYMYKRLNKKGVLIECGFLSNKTEREKLITSEYQEYFARIVAEAIAHYYS